MPIDVFDRFHVPFKFDYTPPPPPPAGDKYFEGYITKLEPWQVVTSSGALNTSSINTIFSELRTTPALQGIKWVIDWGDVETSPNPANWNMTVINELVKRLHQLRQETPSKKKFLFLAVSFRGGASILPPDMRITGGYTPSKTDYTAYKYMWPFVANSGSGGLAFGYQPKTWDLYVQDRFQQFWEKLGNYVVPSTDGKGLNVGDYLYMASTLEGITQTLYDPAYPGWSVTTYEDGIFEMAKRMRFGLPNTMVTVSLNYTRAFLTRTFPKLGNNKIGVNTPNSNMAAGLIATGTNPGILTRFQDPANVGNIILNPELQGDDFVSTYGKDARDRADAFAKQNPPNWAAVDAEYDFPSYTYLHNRARNELNANIIVAQRTFPFWLGGTLTESFKMFNGTFQNHTFPGTRPSFLNFLKTDPDVLAWLAESNTPPINWL